MCKVNCKSSDRNMNFQFYLRIFSNPSVIKIINTHTHIAFKWFVFISNMFWYTVCTLFALLHTFIMRIFSFFGCKSRQITTQVWKKCTKWVGKGWNGSTWTNMFIWCSKVLHRLCLKRPTLLIFSGDSWFSNRSPDWNHSWIILLNIQNLSV